MLTLYNKLCIKAVTLFSISQKSERTKRNMSKIILQLVLVIVAACLAVGNCGANENDATEVNPDQSRSAENRGIVTSILGSTVGSLLWRWFG